MTNRDFFAVPDMPESAPGDSAEQSASQDDTQDQVQNVASTAQEKGQQVAGQAQEKVSQATDQAQEKADQGMDKAASGLGQAADMLRQQGEQRDGTMATAATTTAERLDSASQYLRDKDSAQIMNDLEALVRRKPTESLLVAAGVGFVLSKVLR